MTERNELPEGWVIQPGAMGDNYLHFPNGIVAFFCTRTAATAAAGKPPAAPAAVAFIAGHFL